MECSTSGRKGKRSAEREYVVERLPGYVILMLIKKAELFLDVSPRARWSVGRPVVVE
jgi:hypothetical protein